MLQTDRYWKDFCVALGVPELTDDARFQRHQGSRQNQSRAGGDSRPGVPR